MKSKDKLPGIKQTEISQCTICGKGVCHDGNFQFYIVKIDSYIVDMDAVRRHDGLEKFFGGNALIANIMGPNVDMAKQFSSVNGWVCLQCAIEKNLPVAVLAEEFNRAKEGE